MAGPLTKIEITLLTDGRVQVTGPFSDRILFYGLLESARDVCVAHNKAEDSKAVKTFSAIPSRSGG